METTRSGDTSRSPRATSTTSRPVPSSRDAGGADGREDARPPEQWKPRRGRRRGGGRVPPCRSGRLPVRLRPARPSPCDLRGAPAHLRNAQHRGAHSDRRCRVRGGRDGVGRLGRHHHGLTDPAHGRRGGDRWIGRGERSVADPIPGPALRRLRDRRVARCLSARARADGGASTGGRSDARGTSRARSACISAATSSMPSACRRATSLSSSATSPVTVRARPRSARPFAPGGRARRTARPAIRSTGSTFSCTAFFEDHRFEEFITMCTGRVEVATGRTELISAGHVWPVVIRERAAVVPMKARTAARRRPAASVADHRAATRRPRRAARVHRRVDRESHHGRHGQRWGEDGLLRWLNGAARSRPDVASRSRRDARATSRTAARSPTTSR